MSGSHRKPSSREIRRAQERSNRRYQLNARKAAIAAGTTLAAASIAFGPGLAQATQIATVQNAQNAGQTWSNLIIVADEFGKTQGAILAPLESIAPDGTLPTLTNNRNAPQTKKLSFIEGIGAVAGSALKTPDSSHVPGTAGAFGVGAIAAGLPQYLSIIPLAEGALGQVGTILPKTGLTAAQLALVDGETLYQNGVAKLTEDGVYILGAEVIPGGAKVTKNAGNAILGREGFDPESLLGLPDVKHTTESWNNGYDLPALKINGKTWMVQESYVVDPVTSAMLKEKYKTKIGTLDTLQVQPGKTTKEVIGTKVETLKDASNCAYEFEAPLGIPACGVNKYKTILGKRVWVGFDTKPWGPKTVETPIYGDWTFVADKDADGNNVPVKTIYDPNVGVDEALENLNGIDVPGFSLTKREMGGQYNFLDGSMGWLQSTTQLVIGDKVTTIPVYAAGAALPFGLFEAGSLYTPGLVTQNGQTTSSSMGSRSQSFGLPILGMGVDSTSLLESSQVGPGGIAYNSGWTISTIKLPGIDIPLPLVYSMGSYNVGPNGIGYTSPSFFGIGLPSFQLGDKAGADNSGDMLGSLTGSLGSMIPTTFIALDPKLLFSLAGITDPTGLGLTDPVGTLQKILDPAYRNIVTPGAGPLAQALADAVITASNKLSEASVDGSAKLGQLGKDVNAAPGKAGAKIDMVGEKIKSKVDGLPDIELWTPKSTTPPAADAPVAEPVAPASAIDGGSDEPVGTDATDETAGDIGGDNPAADQPAEQAAAPAPSSTDTPVVE